MTKRPVPTWAMPFAVISLMAGRCLIAQEVPGSPETIDVPVAKAKKVMLSSIIPKAKVNSALPVRKGAKPGEVWMSGMVFSGASMQMSTLSRPEHQNAAPVLNDPPPTREWPEEKPAPKPKTAEQIAFDDRPVIPVPELESTEPVAISRKLSPDEVEKPEIPPVAGFMAEIENSADLPEAANGNFKSWDEIPYQRMDPTKRWMAKLGMVNPEDALVGSGGAEIENPGLKPEEMIAEAKPASANPASPEAEGHKAGPIEDESRSKSESDEPEASAVAIKVDASMKEPSGADPGGNSQSKPKKKFFGNHREDKPAATDNSENASPIKDESSDEVPKVKPLFNKLFGNRNGVKEEE